MSQFLLPYTDYMAEFEKLNLEHKVVDIDLSHKPDCHSANENVPHIEDVEARVVADYVLHRYQGKIGEDQNKKVRILSLAFTDMDDVVFKEVTDKLIESIRFVEHYGILDISFNSITPSSTQQIIQWINKGIQFIYLHGNPMCSMRRVGDLCESMRAATADNEDVVRLMSHIIFLPKYYIWCSVI